MIHIVPTVPFQANGLADYCYRLWEHWPQAHSEWKCLAAHVPAQAKDVWPEGNISEFSTSIKGLLEALASQKSDTVVLHYVGFAYHPKGVPLWLPKALRQWKESNPNNKLVVMFHELYADQVTWKQSSFWLKPLAKGIMISLANLCDQWVTSCPDYFQKVATEVPSSAQKGNLIPVGNTIAAVGVNTRDIWPLDSNHKLKIVVFGLPNTRLWALQSHINLLQLLCRKNQVEAITLLGKPVADPETEEALQQICATIGAKEVWQEKFDLPAQEISKVFLDHDLGLIANHLGILTKSTVYAMLCDHDVIPVINTRTTHIDAKLTDRFPCLISDDKYPEKCESQLHEQEMIDLRSRVKYAAHHVLSWQSITSQWKEVIHRSEKN